MCLHVGRQIGGGICGVDIGMVVVVVVLIMMMVGRYGSVTIVVIGKVGRIRRRVGRRVESDHVATRMLLLLLLLTVGVKCRRGELRIVVIVHDMRCVGCDRVVQAAAASRVVVACARLVHVAVDRVENGVGRLQLDVTAHLRVDKCRRRRRGCCRWRDQCRRLVVE